MSEDKQEPKSVVQPVTANPSANDVAGQLAILTRLLLAKEAREAEKEQNAEEARRARNAQRELSAKTHYDKQIVKQARCRHMKGGKHGPKSGVTDFCVSIHTYINGESVIKCLLCGMKWKAKDTVEFLVRGGRKIANHTKKGWAEALEMVAQSTNSATSSEVPMDAKPAVQFNGTEVI